MILYIKKMKRRILMGTITSLKDLCGAENNRIIADPEKISFIDSEIDFNGENNILFIEDGVDIRRTKITFNDSGSVVYLSKSKYYYSLEMTVHNDNAIFFGPDSYFNGVIHMIASERQNIIIGKDCMFSFNMWIRTADPYIIYSTDTKERINHSKSVYIGDHVMIGQHVLLLKGCRIGSGSIIGASSVLANKSVPSNCSYAGNPAKLIKDGVFFATKCVHSWTEKTTRQYDVLSTENWIYQNDAYTLNISAADESLKRCPSAYERLDLIQKFFAQNSNKNRFFIANDKKSNILQKIKQKQSMFF